MDWTFTPTPTPTSTTSTMDASTPPMDSFTDNNTPTTMSSMNNTLFPLPLPPTHFLSQPRPSGIASPSSSVVVDTTTLAAHDFDVDPRTGFMPPHPPIARLGGVEGVGGAHGEYGKYGMYEAWEGILDEACAGAFRLGRDIGTETGGKEERWRGRVRELPILSITPLLDSEPHLRRAHHVLAWILHFYIHTQVSSSGSEEEEVRIPPPITLPLLRVSREMRLPPVLTYSDDVLYNWAFDDDGVLRVLTSFTGTESESHFYLTSARIELIGVRALGLMQDSLDELFVGDDIARTRITGFLGELAGVVGEMEGELGRMYAGCDVWVFYQYIRPWFQGQGGEGKGKGRWVFEGIDMDPELEYPKELGGPSAGQSSLIHALDIFLGVEHQQHHQGHQHHTSDTDPDSTFLSRMQLYMPRHHRNFLSHLREQSRRRSLRAWVLESVEEAEAEVEAEGEAEANTPLLNANTPLLNANTPPLLSAYNSAVTALKKFRDAHIVLVARYIIGPAARGKTRGDRQSLSVGSYSQSLSEGSDGKTKGVSTREMEEEEGEGETKEKEEMKGEGEKDREALKGTGGTHLARFLKSVRDNTRDAVIQ